MALVLGTNCGFVTVAPTDDPGDSDATMDANARAIRDTSPATAAKITEVGWHAGNATEESNYEMAVYTDDNVNTEPETVVWIDTVNAKGTDAGWKRITGLNISISGNTVYWGAVQLDDTATTTYIDYRTSGGNGYILSANETQLPNPTWNIGGNFSTGRLLAIYMVWEAAAGETPIAVFNYNYAQQGIM